jgi:integrase
MLEISGFNERFVAALRAKPGQIQTDYMESNPRYRGLGIRVGRTGRKTWVFLYQWVGKRVRLSLGSFPAVSLAEARRRMVEARGCIDAVPPVDPRGHFARKEAGAENVEWLIEQYLELSVWPRQLRTAANIERVLRKDVVPVIGSAPLASLHRRDISRVFDAIAQRGAPVGAVRCYTMLRAMFEWAVGRGHFEHNPMEKMSRPPHVEVARDRVLTGPEIKALWHGAEGALAHEPLGKSFTGILRLCLATAARVGEVCGIEKVELDLEARVWKIPAARSKNKHEHLLPLSPLALEVINKAFADSGRSPYLFPSPRTDGPVGRATVTSAVAGLHEKLGIPHFSTHDLRRTAADHMADIGVNQLIIGWVLNHRSVTRATVTSRVYVPRSYEREMREALEAWADRLCGFIDPHNQGIEPVPRNASSS